MNSLQKLFFILFSIAIAAWTTPFEPLLYAQSSENSFAIINATVFDGEKVLANTDVFIHEAKIADIGTGLTLPPGVRTIDGAGQTLLPGLIDAHTHITGTADLEQCLIFGVTSVLDMFTEIATMQRIKRLMGTDQAHSMATFYSAGFLVTAPRDGAQPDNTFPTLAGPDQAQEFIDARITEGSDYIKIMNTLSKETLRSIIAAAHARNKLAVMHIGSLEEAIIGIESGADGLAHLFWDGIADPKFGTTAAAHNIFVIPTLSTLEFISGSSEANELLADKHLSPFLRPADRAGIQRTYPGTSPPNVYESAINSIRQLKDARVPILAGTDAPDSGTAYGISLHRELYLLVQAGLSPIDALAAATSIPAQSFRLEGRGYIKKGMVADLVLVNGDPTQDILATRDIVSVWKNGVKANRGAYKTAAAEARTEDERQKAMPANIGPESGLVSDFESGKIEATFGAGWVISTDSFTGGTSVAEFSVTDNSAGKSKKALMVTGEVKTGAPAPWSGVMFSPGQAMMQPVDLSARKTISFWAKGKEGRYHVMIWAQKSGFTPQMQTFEVKSGWNRFSFPFADFNTDGSDIMGLFIGKSMEQGKFTLYIDDVYIK